MVYLYYLKNPKKPFLDFSYSYFLRRIATKTTAGNVTLKAGVDAFSNSKIAFPNGPVANPITLLNPAVSTVFAAKLKPLHSTALEIILATITE